jgi:hypothetical protein
MRLTIKNHNIGYLQSLAQELGCDIPEALNYLLLTLKHENYYFQKGNQTVAPQPSQPINYYPPTQAPIGFTPDLTINHCPELSEKTDPIIDRIASLIEAF